MNALSYSDALTVLCELLRLAHTQGREPKSVGIGRKTWANVIEWKKTKEITVDIHSHKPVHYQKDLLGFPLVPLTREGVAVFT